MHLVPVSLGGWWRFGVAILGLAGLGAGGVAVFATSLEAGPAALLIIGLIFILTAAGGRMPSRLKVGENEAAWEGVEQFVKGVAQDVAAEQTPELVSALTDLAEVAPAAAAAGLSAVSSRASYERLVMSMLIRAVAEINNEADIQGNRQNARAPLTVKVETSGGLLQTRSDAEISDVDNNLLIIEVKYLADKLLDLLAAQMREQVRRYATAVKVVAPEARIMALLVSNQELTGTALVAIESMPRYIIHSFQYVRVNTEDDFPKLISAVRGAFAGSF